MALATWKVYTGSGEPHRAVLPPPPPWRLFNEDAADGPPLVPSERELSAAVTFQVSEDVVDAVNAALVLRRPLFLTGRPGSGKSSLVGAVARELQLGRVLRWHVTSASTVTDAVYRYDAIGRLHAQGLQRRNEDSSSTTEIGDYLRLGPLGTALLPSSTPRPLLIDEIDKGDIDLPNDLLNAFERGEFEIPELARLGRGPVEIRAHGGDETYRIEHGRVQCKEFPFVVLTSNGERDFPTAFLRRCIRLRMPDPTPELLTKIIAAHLGADVASASESLIANFVKRAQNDRAYATDQLMNAVFLVNGELSPSGDEKKRVVELLLKKLASDAV